MGRVIDLTGKKFGRFLVVGLSGKNRHGSAMWRCRCECGTEKIIDGQGLRKGSTVSCGCLRAEHLRRGREYLHVSSRTHGESRSREHKIWRCIVYRCYTSTAPEFPCYGGRGIRVCKRWRESFPAFLEDMGKAPSLKHTIDRIDNDGPYSPENCRWATRKEQANNRRDNTRISYQGVDKTISQWSDDLGVDPHLLYDRINRRGWTAEKAFTTPVKRKRRAGNVWHSNTP